MPPVATTRIWPWMVTLVSLGLLTTSCQSGRSMQDLSSEMTGTGSVLVLVVPSEPHRVLFEALSDVVSSRVSGTVVYGNRTDGAAAFLRGGNLVRDGRIARSEAAAVAETLACQTIVLCHVLETSDLPPQRLVVEIALLRTADARVLRQKRLSISLADHATLRKYRDFYTSSDNRKAADRLDVDAADISPEMFLRFSATELASALFDVP